MFLCLHSYSLLSSALLNMHSTLNLSLLQSSPCTELFAYMLISSIYHKSLKEWDPAIPYPTAYVYF